MAERTTSRLRRVLFGVVIGLVCSGGLALYSIAGSLRPAAPPPVIATLPDFHFIDQDGHPLAAADLDGKLWVVDFFFARCTSICPTLIERMHDVERWAARHPAVEARLGLLSITVDPEHDTPAALADYARAHAVHGPRFRLATGEAEPVLDVISRGFKIAVGTPRLDDTGRLDILHGGHLVVVDGKRRIRGYYDGDADGLRKLEADLVTLAGEPAGAAAPR